MIDQNFHPALPLAALVESEHNPRKTFNSAYLEELADSIRKNGIIDPIHARPIGGGLYEIASGHCRFRAAKLAGIEAVPVMVREYTDAEFLEVLTIANLHRRDIHPLEEAAGYRELLKLQGWDENAIAARIGKDRRYVLRRMSLLQLTDTASQVFLSGSITLSHALLLARIPATAQTELVESKQLFDRDGGPISVQALEGWIERNVQMALTNAPFSKDDAKLVPAAGACSECPKRKNAQPALWQEVKTDDCCLDRACFRHKCEAHAHQQLVKLERAAKKGAPGPVRVSLAYYTELEGVLSKPKWQVAEEKQCEHAVPAVVVEDGPAGAGMIGDTLKVCLTKTCTLHWGGLYTGPAPEPKLTPLEKAQAALATEEKMKAIAVEKRLAARKLDLAVSLQGWPLDLDLLRRLLAGWDAWALEQVARRLGYEGSAETLGVEALKQDLKLMDEQQLAGLLFELLILDHDEREQIIADVISGHNGDSLEELAAAVEEEVAEEFAPRIAELEAAVEKEVGAAFDQKMAEIDASIAAASTAAAEQKPKSKKGAKA